ncbi:porin family protein [Lutibacter sp. A64]|uniref:porin family protein n=1 Tax=Lutibacter sp. A64 TaxID=2918526 RepID=UPI001F0690C1|nr:porin family protein [Lutibacter sp. A64]UMB54477.1 porin family protein [Lutibacter sp. A64]
MKRIILVVSILFGGVFYASAQQISDNALGLRLGDNDGFGGEISYQHKLSPENRLEIDMGYRDHSNYNAFKLTGLYQWVWNIDGGFNWYAGFGAGIGSWSYDSDFVNVKDDGMFLNADGNVGIEYNFDVPFLISLDFRPEIGIIGDYGKDTDLDLALSVRYQF